MTTRSFTRFSVEIIGDGTDIDISIDMVNGLVSYTVPAGTPVAISGLVLSGQFEITILQFTYVAPMLNLTLSAPPVSTNPWTLSGLAEY